VLLAHEGKENRQTGTSDTVFELVSTADAGKDWSVKQLTFHNPDPSRGLSSQAWLDFADPLHGWVLVRVNGNTAMGGGLLLATDDGGTTWRTLGVPAAGSIHFITSADGWLDGEANGEAGPGVYVTRDGGREWTPITMKAPASFGTKIYPIYQLPEFANKDSGSMLVTFAEPNDESPELALFLTKDGGRTWALLGSAQQEGASWQTTYVGEQWLAMGCPSGGDLTLLRSSALGVISKTIVDQAEARMICNRSGGSIREASFMDVAHAWVLSFGGDLLVTADGGHGWSRITPLGAPIAKPLTSVKSSGGTRIRSATTDSCWTA
jgi:photosystem II stability/assembly factor-like uncharacterized protein